MLPPWQHHGAARPDGVQARAPRLIERPSPSMLRRRRAARPRPPLRPGRVPATAGRAGAGAGAKRLLCWRWPHAIVVLGALRGKFGPRWASGRQQPIGRGFWRRRGWIVLWACNQPPLWPASVWGRALWIQVRHPAALGHCGHQPCHAAVWPAARRVAGRRAGGGGAVGRPPRLLRMHRAARCPCRGRLHVRLRGAVLASLSQGGLLCLCGCQHLPQPVQPLALAQLHRRQERSLHLGI